MIEFSIFFHIFSKLVEKTMLTKNLPRILFLDIETVSASRTFQEMDPEWQELWTHKAAYWLRDAGQPPETAALSSIYQDKAGIYAEFGKIVCISLGILVVESGEIMTLRLNSIYGDDEKKLLTDFAALLQKFYPDPERFYLCGHNIREFDVPYLARRMIIHGMPLPEMLNISGRKPWETKFLLDTLDLWKFGDYKHFTSLKLLAKVLGIPSPKEDIDGSQVGGVYWEEEDLERIKDYCERDVATVASVFLRLNGLEPPARDQIVYTGSQ